MITAKKLTDQQIYALLRNERKLAHSLTAMLKQEADSRRLATHNEPGLTEEKTLPLLHKILIALFAPSLLHPQVYPLLIVFTALTARQWQEANGNERMAHARDRLYTLLGPYRAVCIYPYHKEITLFNFP